MPQFYNRLQLPSGNETVNAANVEAEQLSGLWNLYKEREFHPAGAWMCPGIFIRHVFRYFMIVIGLGGPLVTVRFNGPVAAISCEMAFDFGVPFQGLSTFVQTTCLPAV